MPVLWLGTAERISAIVETNQPGAWVLGETVDEDRERGMGIVVEYAEAKGEPNGRNLSRFAGTTGVSPSEMPLQRCRTKP